MTKDIELLLLAFFPGQVMFDISGVELTFRYQRGEANDGYRRDSTSLTQRKCRSEGSSEWPSIIAILGGWRSHPLL